MIIQIKTAKIICGFIFKACDNSHSEDYFIYYKFDSYNAMNIEDNKLAKNICGKIRYKGALILPQKLKFL